MEWRWCLYGNLFQPPGPPLGDNKERVSEGHPQTPGSVPLHRDRAVGALHAPTTPTNPRQRLVPTPS